MADEFDVGGDGVGLAAAHAGVFEGEVDLGFDASEVAFDFFEGLLAAVEVGEALFEDAEGGFLRFAQGGAETGGAEFVFDLRDLLLELLADAGGVDGFQILLGDAQLQIETGELRERFAIAVEDDVVGLGVAVELDDFRAALFELREAFAALRGEILYERVMLAGFVDLLDLTISRVDEAAELIARRQPREEGGFQRRADQPKGRVAEAEHGATGEPEHI